MKISLSKCSCELKPLLANRHEQRIENTHQILISVQQVLLGHKSIGSFTQPSEAQIRMTYSCMSDESVQGYVHISHEITGQMHVRVEQC